MVQAVCSGTHSDLEGSSVEAVFHHPQKPVEQFSRWFCDNLITDLKVGRIECLTKRFGEPKFLLGVDMSRCAYSKFDLGSRITGAEVFLWCDS